MKTATKVLILGSLLTAGCSGDDGDGMGVPPGMGSGAQQPGAMSGQQLPGQPGAQTPGVAEPGAQTPGVAEPGAQTPGVAEPGAQTPGNPVMEGMNDEMVEVSEDLGSECMPGIPSTSQVPRILNRQYDNIVRDLLGVTTVNGGAPSEMLNDDYDGPMDSIIWGAYQNVAEQIAAEVIAGPNKANFIACDPATVATCYEDTIRSFGQKLFMRPLTDDDVSRFMALTTIEPAGTPDEIAEALLYAFLVSPSFIMNTELGGTADPATGAVPLDQYQVAARLSLQMWGSAPDDALLAAAAAGELATEAQILAQAQRMLDVHEKAGPQVAEAHRAYLVMDDHSHWFKTLHPADTFPNYNDATTPDAAKAELDKFFEEIAFNGGSFQDMFLSNVGYVNQDTAALYGLDPAAYGPELERVELTDRPGFLTRVGFLSSFSNPEVTSPILRGAFITVNMLGANPGAPIDNPPTQPPEGTYLTRREQITALTEPAECSGCHQLLINPPGFVLENYNAVGEHQTKDPLGGDIDAVATVVFSPERQLEIASAQQLMQEIAATQKAQRIYAERLVAFFNNRQPNPNDDCIVDRAYVDLSQPDMTIVDTIANLTQADSFRLRTVGN